MSTSHVRPHPHHAWYTVSQAGTNTDARALIHEGKQLVPKEQSPPTLEESASWTKGGGGFSKCIGKAQNLQGDVAVEHVQGAPVLVAPYSVSLQWFGARRAPAAFPQHQPLATLYGP